jgi:uncharacterized protein with HEPN domain
MPRDPEAYLLDMRDAAAFVRNFTAGRSLADFRSDRGFRSAVERELMILGEAMYQLDQHFPATASRISEYRRIIDFRHILVHGYFSLDPQIVWNIATTKLLVLITEVDLLLGERGVSA